MKRIGCLRDLITIQKLESERDDYGAIQQNYVDHLTIRSNVIINSGKKQLADYEFIYQYDATVIIRNGYDINEDMIIKYKGIKYSITSIIDEPLEHLTKILITKINE